MEPIYALAKAIIKPPMAAWFEWDMGGLEHIPKRGPAILAFNHISYLDPFAAAYVIDRAGRKARFLAKAELFDDRRVAWIMRGSGQIEVRRGTRDAPIALEHALAALRRGELITVFPEGTVTRDPNLYPMAGKTGTARLALLSGVPLIPCALWGTANILPAGFAARLWPPRQDILVRVGRPMKITEPDDRLGSQGLTKRLMEEIAILAAGLRPLVADLRRAGRRHRKRGS